MKRRKIKQADKRDVQACIDQLQAVIDGLKAGSLVIPDAVQAVSLTPGGVVDFDLRVDQLQRRETLRLEMTWLPAALRPATESRENADTGANGANPLEVPPPEPSFPPALHAIAAVEDDDQHGPLSTRTLDRLATNEYQRLYEAARIVGSDGQWHIDQDQLIVSLALAGVDPLTQQELYTLALQADADGRASMLSERVIEAIKRVSQHPPSLQG